MHCFYTFHKLIVGAFQKDIWLWKHEHLLSFYSVIDLTDLDSSSIKTENELQNGHYPDTCLRWANVG